MRAIAGLVLFASSAAFADAPVMSGRAHVEESHVSALISARSAGFGVLYRFRNPEDATPDHPSALNGEVTYAPVDGVMELRGARVWQLTPPARFAVSAQLGVSSYLVTKGPVDFGAGPEGALIAGLGWERFGLFLGAQAGVEAFFRTAGPRVPLRGLFGARGSIGELVAALTFKAGLDLDPDYHTTWRGDVVLEVGWSGKQNPAR